MRQPKQRSVDYIAIALGKQHGAPSEDAKPPQPPVLPDPYAITWEREAGN